MIAAIHQPNYIPWRGYFSKIMRCDVFIFLDDVQYTKNGFINRNRIKTSNSVNWMTIPVELTRGLHTKIREVVVRGDQWREQHLKTLEVNYKKTGFFDEIYPLFYNVVADKNIRNLSELNKKLIIEISNYLGLKCKFMSQSNFKCSHHKSMLLIELLEKANCDTYIYGHGAQNYQDNNLFKENGITTIKCEYNIKEYPQLWKEYQENLSIIDLLFNCGKKSIEYL